jgi:hypothetical protein
MNESSGVLRPVIEEYLQGKCLSTAQVRIMRAYLRQWIAGDWAPCPALSRLRLNIDGLLTHEDVVKWLREAFAEGIDPL